MVQSLLVNIVIISAIFILWIPGLQTFEVADKCENGACSQTDQKPPKACTLLCKRGYTCKLQPVLCKKEPCLPIAKCVPVNPCAYTTCLKGYDCVPKENDPTEAECKLRDPCATVDCKNGYICETVIQSCPLVGPCPDPLPECVPIDPCTYTLCSNGSYCAQSEKDPAVAECTATPCANVLCPAGKKCKAVKEYCKVAPCPRPQGVCVNDNSWPSCEVMLCRPGFVCRNEPIIECEEPPCKKYRGICEPVKGEATCDDVLCEKDKECIIRVFPCLIPPCPTSPICICKNTIIT